MKYTPAFDKSVQVKQKQYKSGDVLDSTMFSERELKVLVGEGWLVPLTSNPPKARENSGIGTVQRTSKEIQAGKWNLDPKLLKGKTIEQLNAMVIERDGQAGIFDTVEEATAFLSADYIEPDTNPPTPV